MTNVEIQEAVRASLPEGAPGTSLPNTKNRIDRLVEWKPQPLLSSFRAGRKRTTFQLNKHNMVTWPTTARMLLELENHGPTERNAFIQRMISLLQNPETAELLTAEEITREIDYSISRQPPYIEQDAQGALTTTDRVDSERAFLEKIEDYRRSADLPAESA